MGFHPFQNRVEVIGVHLNELALLQLVQLLGISHRFQKQLFELVVPLQRTAQVRKPRAQIDSQ